MTVETPPAVIARTERVSAPGATLITDRIVLAVYGRDLLRARPQPQGNARPVAKSLDSPASTA